MPKSRSPQVSQLLHVHPGLVCTCAVMPSVALSDCCPQSGVVRLVSSCERPFFMHAASVTLLRPVMTVQQVASQVVSFLCLIFILLWSCHLVQSRTKNFDSKFSFFETYQMT